MAFDGVTIAGIVKELKDTIEGNRIYKIAQPEKDELLLTIKGSCGQTRLVLSADASLPLIYMTGKNKPSPMTAPNFCMLLRKHLQNARIVSVTQPGLERAVRFELEHLDEMGDLCRKYLIIELMGKHSNIIFCDDKNMIIDSIKHISGMVSSVREVLPGREYFIPRTQDKAELLETGRDEIAALLKLKNMPLYKAIYSSFTGLSPCIAHEICYRAGIDSDNAAGELSDGELCKIADTLYELKSDIEGGRFFPNVVYENNQPHEYSSVRLTSYSEENTRHFDGMSELIEYYYAEKSAVTRIRQRSSDLRKIVQTALERSVKKYELQKKQLDDTKKREKYRIYGELLNAYGYGVEEGATSFEALNYYDNLMVTIPLDPALSAGENAKRYFDKYQKLKRTYEALDVLTRETHEQVEHLMSIATSLDIAIKEEDLVQIKEELIESGYIRRKGGGSGKKREKVTSKPFHYVSSDGFHIYVGKNNFQNDELTFKSSSGNDWWFHAKGIPGSHVVLKTDGKEPPDRAFEEAARLAAHYSQAKGQDKVEIDYTQKKNVKKPGGAKPGFVVYYTNYSMVIDSDITGAKQVEE